MSAFSRLWSHILHETNRHPKTVTATAQTSCQVAQAWQAFHRGGSACRSHFTQFTPLAARSEKCNTQSSIYPTLPWPSVSARPRSTQTLEAQVGMRRAGVWLSRRLLVSGTGPVVDSKGVQSPLSSQWRLAFAASDELELPKATTTGAPTRRGRYRPLETLSLAADKKSGRPLAQPLFSSMKVASLWFVRSSALGRLAVKRRQFAPACNINNERT